MSPAQTGPPDLGPPGLLVSLDPSSGTPEVGPYVVTVESQGTFSASAPAGVRIFRILGCFGASYRGGSATVPG